MSVENEKYCTFLVHYEKGVPPTNEEFMKRLESKKDSVKVEALEELVLHMVQGETYPKLLMTIIRFVVTSNDHRLKKLLMLYWETVEKTKENGELREEMILVVNALRNDLGHANEYVRGSTLRLLCKMKYYRILEPLKDVVMRNLSHRHSYVRRNAVMCVYSMVKNFGIEMIPEACEDIEQLLLVEGDLSTKRNAFLMLLHCDTERAMKYVLSMQEQVTTTGDLFQLAVLELVRKVCRSSPQHRGRCLRIVLNLATSTSMAVSYDCASTLVSLSSSPVAIHQAITAYVTLLTEQSDNNVKLIVLDRLQEVQKKHWQVMEGMVMDIMRALSCPSLDVRKKVMDICLGSLVSARNIKDVVSMLKKEVIKTMGYEAQSTEGNNEYRLILIRALRVCTSQHLDHAQSVMMLLMDFLTENEAGSAVEVILFLRELVANYPEVRDPILRRLSEAIRDMQQARVLRGSLWLLGEYCAEEDLVLSVLEIIMSILRPLPLLPPDENATKEKKDAPAGEAAKTGSSAPKFRTETVILADGTYGTKTVYEEPDEPQAADKDVKKAPLREWLCKGDHLLSSSLGTCLTRLSLKAAGLPTSIKNEILFVVANLYKNSSAKAGAAPGEKSDGQVRLAQCVRTLVAAQGGAKHLEGSQLAAADLTTKQWTSGSTRKQLAKVLEMQQQSSDWALGGNAKDDGDDKVVAPDELVVFRQLRERKGAGGFAEVMDEDDFSAARGSVLGQAAADSKLFAERLAKVKQMTGLADPVYVEAFLQVHSFDLVIELLVVNRTSEVLQNVLVELSTKGDLKIVDRPVGVTLAPGQQATVHASVKVGSTETGIIFGNVTHEKKSATDKEYSVMNELHIDILDYIECATVGEMSFHTMWSEFEWENKININTSITEVGAFLKHIMKNTNMSIVGTNKDASSSGKDTKKTKMSDEDIERMFADAPGVRELIKSSSFVGVNLYAKSIFGEDALANISIEKSGEAGRLTGSVRIRSRNQGLALSLGDRVTIVQRGAAGSKGQPGATK
eukprot:TRINITY_DN13646_c0_g1_i1.p1 TRINITY_DN13646_c0_g1~~TRINITY_DN13646_c0_g1_i1.p1  ORF type:complete len:1017 (-),score=275.67 TRINITY_DN13646_c0_g1_i1:150-3200(-)